MNIIRFKKQGSHLMLIILSICYLVVLFPSQVCEASRKQINIAGLWKSNINLEYKIFQNNTNFTWDVIGRNQKANGKINGLKVSASWQGQKGMVSASGTIRLDPLGRAIAIKWSNGVVFKRDLPPEIGVQENQTSQSSPERGVQENQTSTPSEMQFVEKTDDHTVMHKTADSAEDPVRVTDATAASCVRQHVHISKYKALDRRRNNVQVTDAIPDGKVFVLETASIRLSVNNSMILEEVSVGTFHSAFGEPHRVYALPLSKIGSTKYIDYWVSTVAARAVLGAGNIIGFRIAVKDAWYGIGCNVSLHGYYTDTTCPQP